MGNLGNGKVQHFSSQKISLNATVKPCHSVVVAWGWAWQHCCKFPHPPQKQCPCAKKHFHRLVEKWRLRIELERNLWSKIWSISWFSCLLGKMRLGLWGIWLGRAARISRHYHLECGKFLLRFSVYLKWCLWDLYKTLYESVNSDVL